MSPTQLHKILWWWEQVERAASALILSDSKTLLLSAGARIRRQNLFLEIKLRVMLLTKLITKPKNSGLTEFSKETWLGGSEWEVVLAAFQFRSLICLFFHFFPPARVYIVGITFREVCGFISSEWAHSTKTNYQLSTYFSFFPQTNWEHLVAWGWAGSPGALSSLPQLLRLFYTSTWSKIGRGQMWSFFAFLPLSGER